MIALESLCSKLVMGMARVGMTESACWFVCLLSCRCVFLSYSELCISAFLLHYLRTYLHFFLHFYLDSSVFPDLLGFLFPSFLIPLLPLCLVCASFLFFVVASFPYCPYFQVSLFLISYCSSLVLYICIYIYMYLFTCFLFCLIVYFFARAFPCLPVPSRAFLP